jgi:prophage regulatory protein
MVNFILRLPAVKQRTGLSRSTIYLKAAQGTFPAPVSLGARAIGWVESEVDDWLAGQIAKSRRVSTKTAHSDDGAAKGEVFAPGRMER